MRGILEVLPFLLFLVVVFGAIFGVDLLKIVGGANMPLVILLVLVVIFLSVSVKIVPEYQRAVIFRLGRVIGAKGPGLFILIPIIDRMVKMDLRTVTLDVPTQDIITKDNVSVSVDAVVYFRVVDPVKAVVEVENYYYATSQIAQTTLRSVCGAVELDELLAEREKLNIQLQEIIDRQTDPWGVKVVAVELKKIDLPEELRRAMARQAEAERERRAKIITAEAEYQAAQKLADAAKILASEPLALQIRYLETIQTVSSKPGNTILIPIPLEMMKFFTKDEEKIQGKS
ncbi:slipin family protein [Hydrogenobacter hydrogenophilus]|uniref:Protein QmcA n=1 Tax=Hydrogenobacter hydrogenophilus TaxID=35835 RepID=A0A285NZY0_9AQUI|nr:slipin family protein [Hydrogenobacter hydrogenophilus]SNZ15054.1 SPFH domain, Band 7 family protein [Hydrogenobacter hydrogenophilus]